MLVQLFIVFVPDVLPYSHIIHIDSEVHVSKDHFNLVIEDWIVKVRGTTILDKSVAEYFSDLLRTFFVVQNVWPTFKVAIDEAEWSVLEKESNESCTLISDLAWESEFDFRGSNISQLLTNRSFREKNDAVGHEVLIGNLDIVLPSLSSQGFQDMFIPTLHSLI